jgi:hypothetical protein
MVWFMRAIQVLAVGYTRFDTSRLRSAAEIQGVENVPFLFNTIKTEQPNSAYGTATRITIVGTTILVSIEGS